MASIDVLVLGEAFVDFVPLHRGPLREARGFEMHSGGAPGNLAIGAARLGARVAFVGVVGDDEFGHFLRGTLAGEGIDCADVRVAAGHQTGLCFITLDGNGERRFLHRGGDAARQLGPEDVRPARVAAARAVSFGCIVLSTPHGAAAVDRLIASATGLVCCDPGTCPPWCGDPAVVGGRLRAALQRCHVVKCSSEEAGFAAGTAEPEAAARALVEQGAELAVVTVGAEGAVWARRGEIGHVPAPAVEVVDTTGAGDAFMAALVTRLAAEDTRPGALPVNRLEAHLGFACRTGAAAVTRRGAVAGLLALTP